jgi:hypothetical protein
LLPCQEAELNKKIGPGNWELYKIPAGGINRQQSVDIIEEIGTGHVFVSPIPILMKLMADASVETPAFHVFHNDRRVKRETPDRNDPSRKILISTLDPEGWELII